MGPSRPLGPSGWVPERGSVGAPRTGGRGFGWGHPHSPCRSGPSRVVTGEWVGTARWGSLPPRVVARFSRCGGSGVLLPVAGPSMKIVGDRASWVGVAGVGRARPPFLARSRVITMERRRDRRWGPGPPRSVIGPGHASTPPAPFSTVAARVREGSLRRPLGLLSRSITIERVGPWRPARCGWVGPGGPSPGPPVRVGVVVGGVRVAARSPGP